MKHQHNNIDSIWEPDLAEVTFDHQLRPGDVILVKNRNEETEELLVGKYCLLDRVTEIPISGMMYAAPITVRDMRIHIKCWEDKRIKKFIGCVK